MPLTHVTTLAAFDSSLAAETSGSSLSQEAFCRLYDATARPLHGYLRRMLRNPSRADDLLQDCYLRFLLAKLPDSMSFEHQRHYLFRIATNLAHDESRRKQTVPLNEVTEPVQTQSNYETHDINRYDMDRFLSQLEPRERQLLWLAYVERFNHQEIASVVGAKATSIRSMLFRARTRFSDIMKKNGFKS